MPSVAFFHKWKLSASGQKEFKSWRSSNLNRFVFKKSLYLSLHIKHCVSLTLKGSIQTLLVKKPITEMLHLSKSLKVRMIFTGIVSVSWGDFIIICKNSCSILSLDSQHTSQKSRVLDSLLDSSCVSQKKWNQRLYFDHIHDCHISFKTEMCLGGKLLTTSCFLWTNLFRYSHNLNFLFYSTVHIVDSPSVIIHMPYFLQLKSSLTK